MDRFLLGMPNEKEDAIQHELESGAIMAGWVDVVAEDAAMPLGRYVYHYIVGIGSLVCLNCRWNLSPVVLFPSCHSSPTL